MRTTVQRWGDSLAIRIPSGLAAAVHLREGTEVDVAVEGDRLIVAPAATDDVSLDALLAGITPKNLHGEQAGEHGRGAETW